MEVEPRFSTMAATARSVAWVDGDTLTVADPRTAAPTLTVADLPYGDDHERPRQVTIGERVAVYSVDEGTAVAFDLRSGRAVRLPEYEAWRRSGVVPRSNHPTFLDRRGCRLQGDR
jgi:hypothetical protein